MRNNWITFSSRVKVIEYLGDEQLVHLDRDGTPIQAKLPVEEHVATGLQLSVLGAAREAAPLRRAESGRRNGSHAWRRASITPPRQTAPPTTASHGGVSPRSVQPRTIAIGGTR